jgi:hypothetical protein
MTHGKGKKKKWKSKPKPPPTNKAGLLAVALVLFPIGLGYIVPNNDTVPVVVLGWACWLSAFAICVHLFWNRFRWVWWQKFLTIFLTAGAVAAFAYKTVPDRLRPSYVLVSPLVWFEQGAWYFGFTHRGPKTCFPDYTSK